MSPGTTTRRDGRLLRGIVAESSRLARAIDNILHLASIDAGTLRPDFDWCDPVALLRAAVADVDQALSPADRVTLSLSGGCYGRRPWDGDLAPCVRHQDLAHWRRRLRVFSRTAPGLSRTWSRGWAYGFVLWAALEAASAFASLSLRSASPCSAVTLLSRWRSWCSRAGTLALTDCHGVRWQRGPAAPSPIFFEAGPVPLHLWARTASPA